MDKTTTSAALKLNLCEYRSSDSGATTGVAFVADLIEALRSHLPALNRIVLLEQDSSGTRAADLFALLGFVNLADALDLELFDPAASEWRNVDNVGQLPIELPELVYDVDLLVNVPKMKLHARTAFTGALKNNFGLLRRKWKVPYHERLCETILASNVHLPPQIVVMDGTVTMSGRGPAFGTPCFPSVALCSRDPVAIDVAGAEMLGVPKFAAGHLRIASRSGVGSLYPDITWRDPLVSVAEAPSIDWARFLLANALRKS